MCLTYHLVSASTLFLLPPGPGLLRDLLLLQLRMDLPLEPIYDAPHQPKDSPQGSAGLLDVSALVIASPGLKNETKIWNILFFLVRREGCY